MCLFPGGGFNMQPIVPPSEEGLKHKSKLYVVIFAHLILSIFMLFIHGISGIHELINVLILWCATSQMHFCYLIFYMLMCMYSFIQNFAYIGLLMQDGLLAYAFTTSKGLSVTIMMIFCVFYVVAVYFAFHAYREFKGMM
jgi:hypothetical protein